MVNDSPAGSAAPADSAAVNGSRLGARLRAERQRQGLSLRTLAAAVGVSASMISQIETGKTRPSVSTLYAITSRLGIIMEDLFDPLPDERPASVEPSVVPARASRAGSAARSAVVRPDERLSITMDTGVTWERLGEITKQAIDFLLITYPPGATSSSNGGRMRHSGAEFGLVLSGELVLTLGFDEVHLHPGDAVSFPSTTPHGYRNDGTEPAVGVWFVIERDVFLGD